MLQLREKQKDAGFTLIEVLMALAILSFGLLALASMQIAAIRGNASAAKADLANNLATATLEDLINLPYDDPLLNVQVDPHFNPDNPVRGAYTISWVVSDGPVAMRTKSIRVTVQYDDRQENKRVVLDYVRSDS
jgi:prepilin-type N-terminal cleavage/methylation domain-containing protein